jgi:hypothetical protein
MTSFNKTDSRIILAVQQSVEAQQGGRPIGREKLLKYTGPTLSFLAECARNGKTVNYTQVSAALGLGNAQWANVAFGCVHRILRIVEKEHLFGEGLIPDITAIVTKKGKLSFGRGLLVNNPKLAKMQHLEQLSAVDGLRQEVFRWPYWMQLLALLGLKPLADLDSDDDALAKFASQTGPKGKSPEHTEMQKCIRDNPKLVIPKLQGDVESSSCEYLFWSLDRADVVTKTSKEWIGFEVKPSTAPFEELKKGIFQVIKYRALLSAELLSHGRICRSRCVLVIGGSLPKELRVLATRLGVESFENFRCPSAS